MGVAPSAGADGPLCATDYCRRGEFTTLREAFDFVICAPQEGDAAATPDTAPVLARKLRELRVSAILDIHDLKAHDRQSFVRKFFEALMQAPRDHWNPALLILDEAHLFAPEQGKAESTAAVIDVATRGRKRGLALIAATQRLSKLHKDVAAELLNKLIGRTGLDVDVRRAGDELGMTARDAMTSLRDLQPGEFFAFGPALARSVTKIKIGEVRTTHPKVGDRLTIKTPAPSGKVLTILQELGDLPRAAVEEALTIDQLRADNEKHKRQLSTVKRSPQGVPETEVRTRLDQAVAAAAQQHNKTLRAIADIARGAIAPENQPVLAAVTKKATVPRQRDHQPPPPRGDITGPQHRILRAMARLEALGLSDLHKTQVAAMAGVSSTSGSYANNLGRLRTLGLIDYPQPSCVGFTSQGRQQTPPVTTPPTLNDLHDAWLAIVTQPQQKILRVLISAYPAGALSKDELATRIEVSPDSGSYSNNLGRLRTLGAIEYPKPGHVQAKSILFPDIG
jgi:hypothetical protein